MTKWMAIAGAICAFIAVAAGAFGAHGLEGKLDERMLEVWETAARYQMYHALGLFAVAWLYAQTQTTIASAAGWCFLGGIVLFSGSLYVLALSGIKWLGAITPLGGVLFLAGWVCCVFAATRLDA